LSQEISDVAEFNRAVIQKQSETEYRLDIVEKELKIRHA